jgi:predicted RNA-binding protein with RPS1 domain
LDVDESTSHVKLSIKDIDYRIKDAKKKVSSIKEVGTGFVALSELREVWIKEKLKELT